MNNVPINIQSIQNDSGWLFSCCCTVHSYTNLHNMINDLEINFSYRKSSLPITYKKPLQILKFPIIANLIYHKKSNVIRFRSLIGTKR